MKGRRRDDGCASRRAHPRGPAGPVEAEEVHQPVVEGAVVARALAHGRDHKGVVADRDPERRVGVEGRGHDGAGHHLGAHRVVAAPGGEAAAQVLPQRRVGALAAGGRPGRAHGLRELGVDHPRLDRRDADAEGAALHRQRLGDRGQGVLAGVIHAEQGVCEAGADGRDEDHGAAARGPHPRNDPLDHRRRPEDVRLEHGPHLGEVNLLHRPQDAVGRVAHQAGERAAGVTLGGRHALRHGRRVGDVQAHDEDAGARVRLLGGRDVAHPGDGAPALVPEGLRARPADAAPRAGHERGRFAPRHRANVTRARRGSGRAPGAPGRAVPPGAPGAGA